MKKILIVSCMLVNSYFAKAQPVLTASCFNSIGQQVESYSINDTLPISMFHSGAGQVWNLGAITNFFLNDNSDYVNPSATAYFSDFPSANYCKSLISPDSNWTYYDLQPTYFDILGSRFVSNGSLSTTDYTNVLRSYIFPFNYGDVYNDSYESYSVSSTSAHRVTSMTLSYIGYGTLILPNGTHTNTLLLKRETNSIDTLIINSIPSYRTRTGIGFVFFDPSDPGSLFNVSYDTTFIPASSTVIISYSTSLRTNVVADISTCSLKGKISIYPNPANDYLNYALENNENAERMEIRDITGNIILENSIMSEKGRFDISQLHSGVYFLRICSSDGSSTVKFIHL